MPCLVLPCVLKPTGKCIFKSVFWILTVFLRRFPLSIGAQVFDASTSQLRSAPSAPQDDTTVRGSDPDQETVVKMADKIVREEFARQEAESARDEVEKIAEKKSDA